jgi:site-specific DNA-methyltransferase (adenine-specific)
MADGSVDHIICDPPYDERTHAGVKTTRRGAKGMVDLRFGNLQSFDFVRDLLRVSRGWVVCFSSLEDLGHYRDASGPCWVRAGIWNRLAGTAFARPDRPFQGAEGIAIMHARTPFIFPSGAKRAVWDSPTERIDRDHPTQKPIDLMLELVRDFTISGQTIFDPFAGSGTTGVAALRLGRCFLGLEQNPKHVAFARERLAAESRGLSLQAARAKQSSIFDIIK